MTKRNPIALILLIPWTLGIYGLYWDYKVQQELKEISGEFFDGLDFILLTIFTFGIYAIYWHYSTGKRLADLGQNDNSVLYLVLCLCGLSIVCKCMMQAQINNILEEEYDNSQEACAPEETDFSETLNS